MLRKSIIRWICVYTLCGATGLKAELVLHLGNVDLLPDTPNQAVDLYLQNTGDSLSIAGLELNLQIADGGPELSDFGGLRDGPSIVQIDLIDGTLFEGSQANVTQDLAFPQLVVQSLDLDAGAIIIPTSLTPNQKLATLLFDTTGFEQIGESWTLSSANTLNGASAFFDDSANPIPTIQLDGTLTIQDASVMHHVRGTVALLEDGSPVADATVFASINGNIVTTSTNSQGAYELLVPESATLRLGVELSTSLDSIQGVTTLDILLIRQFILSPNLYSELESTLLGWVGDVNRDGRVSTLDILYIRRLLLNPVDFPFFVTGQSVWVFLRSDLEISELPQNYNDAFERNYQSVTHDINDAHFLVLKMGDINGALSALLSPP